MERRRASNGFHFQVFNGSGECLHCVDKSVLETLEHQNGARELGRKQ
jgi:hypothetical protein